MTTLLTETTGPRPIKTETWRAGPAAAALAAVLMAAGPAAADPVAVICSNALKTALEELAPGFETATGHRLAITWGPTIPLKAAIERGAAFDVTLLTMDAVDDLIREGRLTADTRTPLVSSRAGVVIRSGAPRPDIATVDTFKATLLDAPAIGYVEEGATGAYIKTLLPRLGIADAIHDRVRLLPADNPAAKAVAAGEVSLGMTQISEILPWRGAQLVGPLPAAIGLTLRFGGGAAAGGSDRGEAARALLAYLATPAAAAVFTAKGLDPEPSR